MHDTRYRPVCPRSDRQCAQPRPPVSWAFWPKPALQIVLFRSMLVYRVTSQGLHDGLTGLPTGALLQDRVSQAMRMADRDGRSLALCALALGDGTSDELLQEVAFRLRGALRVSDTVARLAVDQFAVLMPDTD